MLGRAIHSYVETRFVVGLYCTPLLTFYLSDPSVWRRAEYIN
jgi:hypothetical protein